MAKKFYVTTPIYYANSEPHVGSAYTTIAADIFARWHKLLGEKVFFLTGTDEHGQKIQEIAEKAGKAPQKFVDEIAGKFKDAFKLLNISNDFFIRTTNKEHEKEVKKILQELYDKKLIYKGEYEAYYCVECEQYLNKSDLVDGCCPLHKKEPELRKEEAYLFKLSAFQGRLLKLIKSGEYNILPLKKRNEVISFIESGLQDVSFSRLKEKVYWGIELPFNKKHTCFVWVDAFWNYITGLKINNKFKTFWPADLQLMANDILRVHATIWPALLLATGNKLPKNLFIHGYFTINGQKMSKSLGNAISPIYLVDKYGADSLRYFLIRNIPFGQDGDFLEKTLIDRHNNELANKLGNLVSRVAALAEQNGLQKIKLKKLPKKIIDDLKKDKCSLFKGVGLNEKNKIDNEYSWVIHYLSNEKKDYFLLTLNEKIEALQIVIERYIDNYELDKALNEIFAFVDVCNLYVQDKKPWETHDKKVLYELVDSIKAIAILLWPFIPETSEKIAKQFSFKIAFSEIKKPLKAGKIKKGGILFKKIELEEKNKTEKQVKEQKVNKQENVEGVMSMSNVSFSEWSKLDLRVAEIKKVEDIEGADKLYKLTIDVGGLGKRVICAGIKKYYKKEELKGKKIIIIANLEPRIMRGTESKGMLLAAESEDENRITLISPEKDVEAGSRIR